MQRRTLFGAALLVALVLGAWLRLDQLASQILVEDEWHLVHQITYYSAGHILYTFGDADYGIPLALAYLLEANTIGVSELDLRLPMVIAGIAAVVLIPLMLRRRFEDRTLALFALLLAASPFLISYSRMVRTYSLTLLGIYVAYWLFERAVRGDRVNWLAGAAYAVVSGLTVWTHVLTGAMLVTPLLVEWSLAFKRRDGALRPLLALTALTGALMALAVLPPLLADPVALSSKAGRDSINASTIEGAWYLFMGTGSTMAAVAGALLAAVGFMETWRAAPMIRWIWIGTALTVGALLAMRPWWVDHPIAFARYVLPLLPAALLAVSAGLMRIVRVTDTFFERRVRVPMHWVAGSGVAAVLLGWFLTTPTLDILRRPNSHSQHPYFQMDYRKDHNLIYMAFRKLHVTQFWHGLASSPPGTVTVAVAPFRYTTYLWPGPIWEEVSGQRVIPAFLWGTCLGPRHGEVPPDKRFRFRNAVHLGDPAGWKTHGVDYIVYFKEWPERDCEAWVRRHFGPPLEEDTQLIVWKADVTSARLR